MSKPMAIIGGSGFAHLLKGDKGTRATKFGEVAYLNSELGGREVFAIKRHGIDGHKTPPHKVNYRGHIQLARDLGVEGIITTHATGIVNPTDYKPGNIVFPNGFLGYGVTLNGGPVTFFDDSVEHHDMSKMRDPDFFKHLSSSATELNINVIARGKLVTTPGPRYETPEEIALFASWGMDLVGMTHYYESVLAQEYGIRIASIAICTNFGAGIVAGHVLAHGEVELKMQEAGPVVYTLLEHAIPKI